MFFPKLNLRAVSICTILGLSAFQTQVSAQDNLQKTNIFKHIHTSSTPRLMVSTANSTTTTNNTETLLKDTYNIGAGLSDITGEVAEANMFGYADSKQVSTGLQHRLHARAFVIDDGSKELLMVVLDSGMVSQAMHQELLRRLSIKYGNRFNKDNVMLTATHTHSAPGGYSNYFLYNLTTRGFQKPTFDALLNGSIRAIDKAINSQSEGTLEFGTNYLTNASVQRSHTAYVKNPASDKTATEIEPLMQVLKFVKNGQDFASINWFPVHPTNLTNHNTLVSSDNKGYAAWYIEKQRGTDYLAGSGYIAAFPNSNAGDMSPNLDLHPGKGPTDDQWQNAQIIGQRQAQAALETQTTTKVSGRIDYRQNYVDFSNQQIDAKYTVDGLPHTTCPAAYKTAFAAGSTEDGGGGDDLVASNLVKEGADNPFIQAIGYIVSLPSPNLIKCHETKQIAITMGTFKPYPMTPEVLPSQLLRLGNLAIISVPSEFTVTAGLRLRRLVSEKLNLPLNNVIFAGYSNAYAGYITTPEEYAQQDYEGASNHFGPHSLEAWMQNLDLLATAMVNNQTVNAGPTPRDLSGMQASSAIGVVFDNVPINTEFGDIAQQPNPAYTLGDTAQVTFWSAHPKSTLAYEQLLEAQNLRLQEPYTMAIQQKTDSGWKTIATDYDWNTVNKWKRIAAAQSHAILTWDIPKDADKGEYRFYHRGAYKNGWSGQYIAFEGYSNSFLVQ